MLTKPRVLSSLLLILCLTVLGLPSNLLASNPDSLLTVASNTEVSAADRIDAYGDLVYHFEVSDPKKALELGAKGLAVQANDSAYDALGVLNVNIGFVHKSLQEMEEGIKYFEAAAVAFNKAGKTRKAAVQYKNIGIFYRKLGNYTEAIAYQLKGLKLFEKLNDIDGQVTAIMNIGNIYIFQNQPELAFPYFEKALNIAKQQSDTLLLAEALNSYALGFDHLSKNDSAQFYYLLAIDHYKNLGRWVKKAKAEHNVATLFFDAAQYDKAEEMLNASLVVFNQLPTNFAIEKATIQVSLARIYSLTDRNNLAIEKFQEALVIFREKGAKTEMKTTLSYLAIEYHNRGIDDLAYIALEEFMSLKDSIQNVEITTEIAEMNERYESEKKENEILSLQNENIATQKANLIILIVSIGVIALIVIVFLIYRQVKIKELTEVKLKLSKNDRELDILREQIEQGTNQYLTSKHFTFNREEVNGYLKEDLSERELDVFMYLIKGHTNKEIGDQLFISVSTIKFHLQKIYVKLDVNNRKDAVQILNSRTGKAA